MRTTSHLDSLVEEWLAIDVNPETREEIFQLQKRAQYEELDKRLSTRIAFGTAGLRSSMQAGFAHMNDVTVLQASQGLVQYLCENVGNSKDLSIVVGYDHRHNSQRFAELTASCALLRGFKVYYLGSITALSRQSLALSKTESASFVVCESYDSVVHTPMVPFSINHYGASAGVMVTASHNPAQDNGYKVYYSNGCQIIPPHDDGIATSISNNLIPWDGVWDIVEQFTNGIISGKLVNIHEEAHDKYLDAMTALINPPYCQLDYSFVYTPVHGVGLDIFAKMYRQFFDSKDGFSVALEQAYPDPDFPTVSFPNPEEKGALDIAMQQADKLNRNLVVANDPDADRFSVAVKSSTTGTWKQLTGNEIGFLFAMWTIEQTPKYDLEKTYLVNSTVSSQVLKSMADYHGFHFEDTLTGFKWIGNRAIELKKAGWKVPFGYEEAIGYMFGSVNDKDGIAASAIWLQLYQKWFANNQGKSALDKLVEGYERYGWFKECNGYYKLDDLSKTAKIFQTDIRQSFDGDFPNNIGDLEVISWRDLTIGYDSTTKSHKPKLPTDAKSQMITATVRPKDGSKDESIRFTCRGSGTEPKLKVYIEAKSNLGEERATELARYCWDTLKTQWFKPEINGLKEVV
ncbi:phosphoribomutase [[Candida] anglica]|uniref:Phosphoribomutase n=1 Tax=[Candida] anglica TaxID=148631 RepID=A0ABP0E569_9ASCO